MTTTELRIVERSYNDGTKDFIIEKRHKSWLGKEWKKCNDWFNYQRLYSYEDGFEHKNQTSNYPFRTFRNIKEAEYALVQFQKHYDDEEKKIDKKMISEKPLNEPFKEKDWLEQKLHSLYIYLFSK